MKLRITVVEAPAARAPERASTGDEFVYDLDRDARISLGRGTRCDISLASRYIGRQHAVVTIQDGEVWLKDQCTTNGTYVDGIDGRIDRVRVTADSPTIIRVADILVVLAIER